MDAKVPVSIYENSKDTRGIVRSLSVVIQRIQTGDSGLAKKTLSCNALALTDPKEYKEYKENKLLSVTFAGTFPRGKRKAEHISQHSGLIVLDIDGLTDAQIPDLLAELAQMPQVVLAFISPSRKGIKVVVSVTPRPENDLEHKGGYHACLEFFDDLATEYGFEIDTSGKDCSRLCFLSHDPLAIVNTNAPPIDWDKEAWLTAEKEKQQRFEADAKIPYTGEVDITALDYIDPHDLSYNQWLSVITACKVAGLSWQQADQWSQRGGIRYQKGEVESRWSGLNLEVSWGAVVNLAKTKGYVLPKRNRRPTAKLHKSVTDTVFDTLRKSRDIIAKAWQSAAKVIAIRGDTGVGKTHETKAYLIDAPDETLLMSTPTTELASEVTSRFESNTDSLPSIDTFQHSGLLHGYSQLDPEQTREQAFYNGSILCIYGYEADAYRRKGGNMYKVFCPQCPVYTDCQQRGYLSQHEQAKQARAVILPFAQSFTSPMFSEFTKDYLTSYHNKNTRTALIDDVNIFDLFIEVTVSKARLQAIAKMWEDKLAGNFASDLLHYLEIKQDLSGLRDVINYTIGRGEAEQLRYELQNVRIDETVMSLDQAVQDGIWQREDTENMPQVDGEWTLFDQLYDCLKHYQRDADMPVTYENDMLSFHVPPRVHAKIEKLVLMSATLQPPPVKKVFGEETEIFDAPPTEWDKDAKVFQLRTHNAPRRTVYAFEKEDDENWKATGLSETGKRLWQIAENGIRSHPEKRHALITYKQVVTNWLKYDIDELDLVTSHYGGLTGLDEKFEDCDTFWILFAPNIPPDALKMKARILYGDTDTPLCFDRDASGNFVDPRVQQVFEMCVLAELTQAVGRARLVSKGNTVILLCAHELKHITERAILFDEIDWKDAGENIDQLEEVVDTRENAEIDAEATGDVKKTMDVKGIQKSQAYELTKTARDQQRKERDDHIIELHREGHSQREIEGILKNKGYKKASRKAISKVVQNSSLHKEIYNVNRKNAPPPKNTDVTHLDSEIAIIEQLNAGNFDRLAISEELAIDVEGVRAVLGELLIVDPRLTVETQQKLKKMHQSRRPPALPPAHERPPPWIPPEDWEYQIESRYRDGASITEIADAVRMPEEIVKQHIAEQPF